jgi:hypothetical protein
MTRRILFCAAVMATALVGRSAARAEDAPPDFTGDWRLDAKHSDLPPTPGGGAEGQRGRRGGWGGGGGTDGGGRGGWGGGGMGGGGWGGRGSRHGGGGPRSDDPAGREGGSRSTGRPARFPDLMHVTETGTLVSFEDSAGAVVREVATVPAEADTFARAPGADHVAGQWKGEKLVVQRTGPMNSKVTETMWLKDKGKSLEIDTKLESSGDMPSRELKRVYNRVTQT